MTRVVDAGRVLVHPRAHGPWPGRWRRPDGSVVFGLLDPESGAVEAVEPAHDAALPGLATWLGCGDLLTYQPGRRAVVRTRRDGETSYVKIVRPRRWADLDRRVRNVEAESSRVTGFPAVAPRLGDDPSRGVVVFAELRGTSLHDTLLGGDDVRGTLDVVARGLARLHSAEPSGVDPLAEESPRHWAVVVARADEDEGRRLCDLARRVAAPPEGAPFRRLVHGDLHDKNIVLTERGAGVLDLDRAAVGDPITDVGNLTAHLVLRALQTGRPSAVGWDWARVLAERYVAAGGTVDARALHGATARTLFRLACLYHFRPRWSAVRRAVVGELEHVVRRNG